MEQKRMIRSILSILLCIILTACNVNSLNEDDRGLSEDQTLRITETTQISSMDSAKYVDLVSWNVLYNVNEGLMRIGRNNQLVEGMASDVEISPDKKTYKFKIREDAVWNDGKPVTAHDFEYAWKRALDPKTKSEYAYILFPIVGAERYNKGLGTASEVGVNAIDDHTLVVKLRQPQLTFLSLTTQSTYFPQRKDIVEKYKDKYATSPDTLLYNGPFKIQSITPMKVVLTKNETYWDKNTVSLNKVEIHVEKETAKRISMYNSNQVDSAILDSEFVSVYKQTPDYLDMELASSQYLLMNQKKPFFKNENIRRAISLAIDRDEIANKVLKDGSKPAYALVPPPLFSGNKPFRQLAGENIAHQDAAKAQEYFAKGLKELGLTEPPNSITLLSFDDQRKNVAISIKNQLKNVLGIEVKIDLLPRKLKVQRELNGEFDMTLSSWFADYSDPIGFLEIWHSNSKLNYVQFKNSRFDQLITEAKQTSDEKKKTEYMIEAEKLLVGTDQQASIVPLYYESSTFIQRRNVKDFYRHSYGAEYDLKWVYISKKKDK